MRNIPQSLIRDKIYCVNYIEYLSRDGAREHIYIAVKQDDMARFKDAIKRGNFDAEDYGIILEHGKGSASPSIREKMKMLYKCDHESAISIKDYVTEEDRV